MQIMNMPKNIEFKTNQLAHEHFSHKVNVKVANNQCPTPDFVFNSAKCLKGFPRFQFIVKIGF
jgi:hypothetical protein